jgi:hypothetical protein
MAKEEKAVEKAVEKEVSPEKEALMALIERYKKQSPAKYELRKAELEKQLGAL